ncbi:MAG: hypothetical protein IT376_22865 [Polyangiaceae bacterium]|nr:hypothetical protein [Polyangiaceae bacterium]
MTPPAAAPGPAGGRPAPLSSDRLVALDAALVAGVTVAILFAARDWVVMSGVVAAAFVVRLACLALVPRAERGLSLGAEATLHVGLAVLGGFNDWNSVCHHRIYEYTVPVDLPAWSTIPTWMLFYWGQILRLIATVARWPRLGPPAAASDTVWLGRHAVRSAGLKIALELGLLFGTRQCIYRLWAHPVASWLPFAIALVAGAVLFRPRAYELRLIALVMVAGPLAEIAYIAAGLHRYALGWFGGVPLWIVLWWGLAVLLFSDLATRALAWLAQRPARAEPGAPGSAVPAA